MPVMSTKPSTGSGAMSCRAGAGGTDRPKFGRRGGAAGEVREAVMVAVAGPGVGAAVSERVGAGRALDAGAEAVAIGIIGGDRPWRKRLGGVGPVGAVIRGVRYAVAVAIYRRCW